MNGEMNSHFKAFFKALCVALLVIGFFVLMVYLTRPTPEEQVEIKKQTLLHSTRYVTLPNGLECVRYVYGNTAGLSCNWEKFNAEEQRRND